MEKNLFISILICCYNSEKYISDTLDSVLIQKYSNYEIVIVDDGSEDNTKNIIEKKLLNKEYIYKFQKNKGLSESRNLGLSLCNSNYIFILDHDDIMDKNRLENQVKEIINNKGYSVYFGNSYLGLDNQMNKYELIKSKSKFDINIKEINNILIDEYLLMYGCFIASSTVVINKSKLSKYFFNEKFNYVTDYDFFIEQSTKNKFFKSNNIYASWRINDNQISSKNIKKNLIENIQVYNKYFKKNKKYILNFVILKNYIKIHLKNFIYIFIKK